MEIQETDAITSNFNDVLSFLPDVAVKAPILVVVPLLLLMDKHAQEWLWHWSTHHISPLSTSVTATPQDHSGLTGVLSNVAMRLQNADALRPIVAAQHKADKEMRV